MGWCKRQRKPSHLNQNWGTKEGRDAVRAPQTILKLDRLRLGGPNGAKDEFLLAAAAQNLRKLAKIIPMQQPATT